MPPVTSVAGSQHLTHTQFTRRHGEQGQTVGRAVVRCCGRGGREQGSLSQKDEGAKQKSEKSRGKESREGTQ